MADFLTKSARRRMRSLCVVFCLCLLWARTLSFTSNPRNSFRRRRCASTRIAPYSLADGVSYRKATRIEHFGEPERLDYAEETSAAQTELQDDDETSSIDLKHLQTFQEQSLTEVTSDRDEAEVWKARVLLLGAAALYGTNFALVKILGDTMPVGVSSTLRFGLATLALTPWLVPSDKENLTNEQRWGAVGLGFEVGLWNSIGYVAQAVGLETTDASKSAFLCSLAVVVVPLIDVVSGKRLRTREWVGALMAVLGVALLELGGGQAASSEPILSRGDLYSLVQPFAFGMGFWRMENAMRRYPTQASRSAASQLLAVFLASAAFGAWSLDAETLANLPWHEWLTSPSIVLSLLWTGMVTTGLSISMETNALKTLSAAETTVLMSAEPIFGTAFAAVVIGEQLGVDSAIGSLLILAGCVYSNLGLAGIQSVLGSSPHAAAALQRTSRFNASVRNTKDKLSKRWLWLCAGLAANMVTFASVVNVDEEASTTAGAASVAPLQKLSQTLQSILDRLPI